VFVSGEPAYEMGSAFVNLELPVSEHATLYSFGGYSRLDGTSFNFFRRAGQDETVRALWPDGYLPLQDIELQNYSGAVGARGDGFAGIKWDLSSVYGASVDDLGYDDSNNVSLGAASPRSFDRGGSRFRQSTTNLDLTREFDVNAASPLKVAFGLEFRRETYELVAGDAPSYTNGNVPILDGPNAGRPAPVGGQPSGGLSPAEALSVSRHSKAAYTEVEQELFGRWLLSGAMRTENYSDFGDTTDYKAATRFRLIDSLSLRGSFGTGFRAPNLAQSYNSSSNISFVNGAPLRIRQIAVNDPVAPLVGASALKPETSRNVSLGVVFDVPEFTASLDVYRIRVADRIALSSNFQSTALTNLLAANGFPGIAAVSYETNAVDTTTKGVDLTVSYAHDFGAPGRLNATLAANYNKTEFDRIAGTPATLLPFGITAPLFDLTQQVRFTNSLPKDKVSLNLNWKYRAFTTSLTATRYGEVAQVSLTARTPAQVAALIPGYDVKLVSSAPGSANSDIIQYFGADIVTDLDFAYDFNDHVTVAAGASNLFDKYPDKQIASTVASVAAGTNGADNTGTLPYAYIAPYGFSGRFLYVKGVFRF
jgi:iron complex outermembrane receptor protein